MQKILIMKSVNLHQTITREWDNFADALLVLGFTVLPK